MRTYQIIIFALVLQTVLLLAHWFLYRTIIKFLSIGNPSIILALKIGLVILAISLVVTSIISFAYNTFLTRLTYTVSAVWLGLFYYLIIATFLVWLGYGLSNYFSFSLDTALLAKTLFGLAMLVGIFGIFNAGIIRVTKISVALPNLPPAWQGKTAVWVGDMHLGQIRNIGFAQKIAALVQNQQPDIVFIGGDLYDGVVADLNKLAEPFGAIKTSDGIYFITGNHEEFSDPMPYLNAIKKAGIHILLNEKIDVAGLQIIGVDDRDSLNKEKFPKIMESLNIDKSKPSILLKHTPLLLGPAENAGISFQISGHTHLGQIFPNSIITHFVYSGFDYGLKKMGDMFVFTSSGAGTWGPPMRIGAAPEIVVIKFQ